MNDKEAKVMSEIELARAKAREMAKNANKTVEENIKEEEKEVMAELNKTREEVNEMMNDTNTGDTLFKCVLESASFESYEIKIPYTTVMGFVKMNLAKDIDEVLVDAVEYKDFYNAFLEKTSTLTIEDKKNLALQYYPSSIVKNTGIGVNNLLAVKVNSKKLSSLGMAKRDENKAAFNWTSDNNSVAMFSKKYPEFFGDSNLFLPAVKRGKPTEETDFLIYLNTIATVSEFCGLSKEFLIKNRIAMSIAERESASTGELFYLVKFTRR